MNNRTVFLKPEHSSWWLLSPGVTLLYDRVVMLRSDYDQILEKGGRSSYNDAVARHIEAIVKEGLPEIEVVENYTIALPTPSYCEEVRDDILTMAEDTSELYLEPHDPLRLTIDAYGDWIAYNERKLRFLHHDETVAQYLEKDMLPAWRDRRSKLLSMLNEEDREIVAQFREDKHSMRTFTALITAALQCIAMADSGWNVYDPLLAEYIPIIQLLERLRSVSVAGSSEGGIGTVFAAYQYRMQKYGQPLPIEFRIEDIPDLVRVYKPIRLKLAEVDRTLREISEDDPARAFEVARKEIAPLVEAVRTAEKVTEYSFWAVGLFAMLAAISAAPDIVERAKDRAGTLALVERNVGRFAGAFAVVVDEMIIGQRQYFWRKGSLSYPAFCRTFWDSGEHTQELGTA